MAHAYLDPQWQPYRDFDTLLNRIKRIAAENARCWRGTLFRFEDPEHAATGDRLMGVGAKLWSGRWNPKGLAATYGAMTRETALAETFGSAGKYGLGSTCSGR